ncbi:MAG: dUTP diphosphatase [Sulfurimonadaceae bacterium]|nr:dUTP diphosphatase [Sulfurimonadaceae bacterium]
MDKVLQMLQLQQQLNDATNGENWEKGVTKNGKTIDWKRCIYMECAEMIDSFAWKHWKSINQEPDWANLQIEVVDVWHFVMSLALQEYRNDFRGSIEDLAMHISQMPAYAALSTDTSSFEKPDVLMKKIEEVMLDSLVRDGFDLDRLIVNFFELTLMSGLDIATLYRLYVGKNILNQFRQDHGYKEGTYIKEWNGREDNAVMKGIWEENGELKPEALYTALKQHYPA